MDAWIESVSYQELVLACRSGDQGKQAAIVERRLAETNGAEKAFWLRARARQRIKGAALPPFSELAWSDLVEALHVAPQDHPTWAITLSAALDLCVTTESFQRAAPTLKNVRWISGALRKEPVFWHSVGMLRLKLRKWCAAERAFTRALRAYSTLSATRKDNLQCRLAHSYAWRAVAAAASGMAEQAAADVEQAFAMAACAPHGVQFAILGLAKAEVAFSAGRVQEARIALQQGLMEDGLQGRKRLAPSHQVETELLAARMARAEGNMVGFAHFCDRALALCNQYDLSLTRDCVQAVQAGAER